MKKGLYAAKKPLLSFEEAQTEANRCIYCYDAPCTQACPTSINIPQFIARIGAGDNLGSAQTILEANILGASCASVCPVEVLCEGSCVYNHLDNPPIAIGRLQKYALDDFFANLERNIDSLEGNKAELFQVAAIGAGPASLSFAAYCALNGGRATIYEAQQQPGGLNTYGVAPYKLGFEESLAEIELIRALGVEFCCGEEVGSEQAQKLLAENDAVFLGVGLGADSFVLDNQECRNVVGSLPVIEALKQLQYDLTGVHTALVIGGGNTALDVAQELALAGVTKVIIAYRRDSKAMSGYAHELSSALQLGVDFRPNHTPVELLASERDAQAMRFATPEGDQTLNADLFVFATGQHKHKVQELFPQLEIDEGGRVLVDGQQQSSVAQLYAGGDCVNGGKEVVNAVAEGRQAAYHLLQSLNLKPGFGSFN